MAKRSVLSLFDGFGVELEYAIVCSDTLAVLPVCDWLLASKAGEAVSDVDDGDLSWSNELVLHVVEMKTNGPAKSLEGLGDSFARGVYEANSILASRGAELMPTAMHPTMRPFQETRIWPHEYNEVYRTFDRIFGCSGHGWSNLQSAHLNLPFKGAKEFGALHAAIRLVLPIIPALSASSPIVEGRLTGLHDNRLEFYRNNCAKIPMATGKVIPEPVFTPADYKRTILGGIYTAFEPYDPEGTLRHEWCNARGAIARFDRNAIEIRVIDVQECPNADIAVLSAVVSAVRALVEQVNCNAKAQRAMQTEPLAEILHSTMEKGEAAEISDPHYLSLFGLPDDTITAGTLWRVIAECSPYDYLAPMSVSRSCLNTILTQGTLSTRMLRALGDSPTPNAIADLYRSLCTCLADNHMFAE